MKFPEQYRDLKGYGSRPPTEPGDDFGWFVIPPSAAHRRLLSLRCMVSSGCDEIRWEHVSVSTAIRCPTWDEMCLVKSLFWNPDELVVQFHPPESEYINQHPYCLHLWKPLDIVIPTPPMIAVGVR